MKLHVEKAGLTPLNGCRACGEDFTSLETFDGHQPGDCLTDTEMQALGWEQDAKGRWTNPLRASRAYRGISVAAS